MRKLANRLFKRRKVEVYLGTHDAVEKNIEGEPDEHRAMATFDNGEWIIEQNKNSTLTRSQPVPSSCKRQEMA